MPSPKPSSSSFMSRPRPPPPPLEGGDTWNDSSPRHPYAPHDAAARQAASSSSSSGFYASASSSSSGFSSRTARPLSPDANDITSDRAAGSSSSRPPHTHTTTLAAPSTPFSSSSAASSGSSSFFSVSASFSSSSSAATPRPGALAHSGRTVSSPSAGGGAGGGGRTPSKQLLQYALDLAQQAVELDQANRFVEALAMYRETVARLGEVMSRVDAADMRRAGRRGVPGGGAGAASGADDEGKTLRSIHDAYLTRIELLAAQVSPPSSNPPTWMMSSSVSSHSRKDSASSTTSSIRSTHSRSRSLQASIPALTVEHPTPARPRAHSRPTPPTSVVSPDAAGLAGPLPVTFSSSEPEVLADPSPLSVPDQGPQRHPFTGQYLPSASVASEVETDARTRRQSELIDQLDKIDIGGNAGASSLASTREETGMEEDEGNDNKDEGEDEGGGEYQEDRDIDGHGAEEILARTPSHQDFAPSSRSTTGLPTLSRSTTGSDRVSIDSSRSPSRASSSAGLGPYLLGPHQAGSSQTSVDDELFTRPPSSSAQSFASSYGTSPVKKSSTLGGIANGVPGHVRLGSTAEGTVSQRRSGRISSDTARSAYQVVSASLTAASRRESASRTVSEEQRFNAPRSYQPPQPSSATSNLTEFGAVPFPTPTTAPSTTSSSFKSGSWFRSRAHSTGGKRPAALASTTLSASTVSGLPPPSSASSAIAAAATAGLGGANPHSPSVADYPTYIQRKGTLTSGQSSGGSRSIFSLSSSHQEAKAAAVAAQAQMVQLQRAPSTSGGGGGSGGDDLRRHSPTASTFSQQTALPGLYNQPITPTGPSSDDWTTPTRLATSAPELRPYLLLSLIHQTMPRGAIDEQGYDARGVREVRLTADLWCPVLVWEQHLGSHITGMETKVSLCKRLARVVDDAARAGASLLGPAGGALSVREARSIAGKFEASLKQVVVFMTKEGSTFDERIASQKKFNDVKETAKDKGGVASAVASVQNGQLLRKVLRRPEGAITDYMESIRSVCIAAHQLERHVSHLFSPAATPLPPAYQQLDPLIRNNLRALFNSLHPMLAKPVVLVLSDLRPLLIKFCTNVTRSLVES